MKQLTAKMSLELTIEVWEKMINEPERLETSRPTDSAFYKFLAAKNDICKEIAFEKGYRIPRSSCFLCQYAQEEIDRTMSPKEICTVCPGFKENDYKCGKHLSPYDKAEEAASQQDLPAFKEHAIELINICKEELSKYDESKGD